MADEQHDADDINFNEAVKRAQFITIHGMGNAFGLSSDRQSAIFTKKADEIDPVQAIAIQAAMKGGE